MPHFFVLIVLATGALIVSRLLRRETGRVRGTLDRQRRFSRSGAGPVRLERDPQTGVYRPGRYD